MPDSNLEEIVEFNERRADVLRQPLTAADREYLDSRGFTQQLAEIKKLDVLVRDEDIVWAVVPLDSIDEQYPVTSQSHVKQLADDYLSLLRADSTACTLWFDRENGKLKVSDGFHTYEAARDLGVPSMVAAILLGKDRGWYLGYMQTESSARQALAPFRVISAFIAAYAQSPHRDIPFELVLETYDPRSARGNRALARKVREELGADITDAQAGQAFEYLREWMMRTNTTIGAARQDMEAYRLLAGTHDGLMGQKGITSSLVINVNNYLRNLEPDIREVGEQAYETYRRSFERILEYAILRCASSPSQYYSTLAGISEEVVSSLREGALEQMLAGKSIAVQTGKTAGRDTDPKPGNDTRRKRAVPARAKTVISAAAYSMNKVLEPGSVYVVHSGNIAVLAEAGISPLYAIIGNGMLALNSRGFYGRVTSTEARVSAFTFSEWHKEGRLSADEKLRIHEKQEEAMREFALMRTENSPERRVMRLYMLAGESISTEEAALFCGIDMKSAGSIISYLEEKGMILNKAGMRYSSGKELRHAISSGDAAFSLDLDYFMDRRLAQAEGHTHLALMHRGIPVCNVLRNPAVSMPNSDYRSLPLCRECMSGFPEDSRAVPIADFIQNYRRWGLRLDDSAAMNIWRAQGFVVMPAGKRDLRTYVLDIYEGTEKVAALSPLSGRNSAGYRNHILR